MKLALLPPDDLTVPDMRDVLIRLAMTVVRLFCFEVATDSGVDNALFVAAFSRSFQRSIRSRTDNVDKLGLDVDIFYLVKIAVES